MTLASDKRLVQYALMPPKPLRADPASRAAASEARLRALAGLPLFQGLNDSELNEVAAWSTSRTLAPGRCAYRRGEDPQGLYVVLTGELEVVRPDGDTEERVVGQVGPGDIFGEAALLDDRPHRAEVRAVRESEVAFLSKELLDRFFEEHPSRRLRLRTLAVTRRLAKVSDAFSR